MIVPPGFPPHVPGLNARPPEGAFSEVTAGLGRTLAVADLASHPALAAGLALIAAGYDFEAHDTLEPLWRAAPPACRERHMLHALIQFANARLKQRMGRPQAAAKVACTALDALDEASLGGPRSVLGLDVEHWRVRIMKYIS
ncbi:MAG: DUF309 domain-containing protein [Hyphomicrobiales bacterium]|nr:DUF309 domain-containing protein [Hyphomicrobiales bacterium]MDE2016567.1 DUF309 domain-containing protein [Hyphomicrobiales bacterium]